MILCLCGAERFIATLVLYQSVPYAFNFKYGLSYRTDLARRAQIVAVILEEIEGALTKAVQGATALTQRAVLPALTGALVMVPPKLDGALDTPENKFRASVIELIGRLPIAETPKHHLKEVLNACHSILTDDHEENGMIAQRVLFDIHKMYKNLLEEQSGPFFDWLKKLYESFPESAARQLKVAEEAGDGKKPLVPASESLKLTAEVALMIVFLLQSYPKRLSQYSQTLFPLMVAVRIKKQMNKSHVV